MGDSRKVTTSRDRWTTTSVAITAAIFLVSAVLGFVLLPRWEAGAQVAGIWDSICRAAGLPRQQDPGDVVTADYKTSLVKLATAVSHKRDEEAIGRGATLAQQCAICHGPTGVSRADSPNLAGQYASVVYKQLRDFKDGVRVNAVMTPFALKLSEQDMQDLAAYYAYLPRLPGFHPPESMEVPRIVESGAPLRGIAPCGSCHGNIENKLGSPWLEGQSDLYLKTQLEAFVSGSRQNDISKQMRNVARAMSAEEIEQAAKYYANKPPPFLTQ
ncbi:MULTISPECIES: c-type cytochrome [unclassified Rhizobium]|uniref:c-type cytochrome n=1 Tax=unclassified Rhizobium TaxID=2613769 RepID=UPI00161DB4AF|nr:MULTISPECIES: c-type cytochrome [unclassified Rhizobium]MBB3541650.1 cytochrome c553 [Rhizobium sp. BK399]MCS3740770.1 cytochrome c553 [Rhizobium sp. BK661]MCS4092395.1 cytochrome c553 [Rhizobium sp. BK176]